MEILPEPGIVLKTSNRDSNVYAAAGEKVFVNICYSNELPKPPTASEEEILEAIHGHDNGYRVPMSLSECKYDRDKKGNQCIVIDAAVNTQVFDMARKRVDFRSFLQELCLSWIEEKYGFILSRDLAFPKMKSKGELSRHKIAHDKLRTPKIEEIESYKQRWNYELVSEPEENQGYLKLTFPLLDEEVPRVKVNAREVLLERDNECLVRVTLPHYVDIDVCDAEFDASVNILTVKLNRLI